MYTAVANTSGNNIASPQPHRMNNPPPEATGPDLPAKIVNVVLLLAS
jgi:hypothetical protein